MCTPMTQTHGRFKVSAFDGGGTTMATEGTATATSTPCTASADAGASSRRLPAEGPENCNYDPTLVQGGAGTSALPPAGAIPLGAAAMVDGCVADGQHSSARFESLQKLHEILQNQTRNFMQAMDSIEEQVSSLFLETGSGASGAAVTPAESDQASLPQQHTRPNTPTSTYSTSSCTSRTPPCTSNSDCREQRRSLRPGASGVNAVGLPYGVDSRLHGYGASEANMREKTLQMWSHLGSTLQNMVERNSRLEEKNRLLRQELSELQQRVISVQQSLQPRSLQGSPVQPQPFRSPRGAGITAVSSTGAASASGGTFGNPVLPVADADLLQTVRQLPASNPGGDGMLGASSSFGRREPPHFRGEVLSDGSAGCVPSQVPLLAPLAAAQASAAGTSSSYQSLSSTVRHHSQKSICSFDGTSMCSFDRPESPQLPPDATNMASSAPAVVDPLRGLAVAEQPLRPTAAAPEPLG